MIIKVCGMREPENIRDLMALKGVDWMGLIFYPKSSRFVEEVSADSKTYRGFEIEKVGVFVNATEKEILDKADLYGLQKIQLHGEESPEFIKNLRDKASFEIIKVFRVGEGWNWKQTEAFLSLVDWFLLDTAGSGYGGTGKKFDWEVLERYPFDKPFLLSGGIDEDSVEALVDLYRKLPPLKGVDINSKFEHKPGVKNMEMIARFVTKLRKATE
ncbi:phosphoribosylanthranilate isomerase [Negadavirga shengliensis]|uniref:N-(5'-phosphoribosyl)anthranilate isomerase n=1 Tax=Negadavirga shengliensis TaxID=1389218 RepID=A0ABV9T1H7_9BACT